MIDKLSGMDILAMQHVTRWHMVRTRRHQTLAEHSCTVAMLAFRIGALWNPSLSTFDRAELLDRALSHDAHEVEYGDMPGIVKRLMSEYDSLSGHAFWRKRGLDPRPAADLLDVYLNIADKFEAFLFYSLEGDDPRIKEGLWLKVRELMERAKAPKVVRDFVMETAHHVVYGDFTPQPGEEHRDKWGGEEPMVLHKLMREDKSERSTVSMEEIRATLTREHEDRSNRTCRSFEDDRPNGPVFSALQDEIGEWADEQFPGRTPRMTMAKLVLEEIPEFLRAMQSGSEVPAEEYADLAILIMDVAYQEGIDITQAVEEKMKVNKARTWAKTPDGFWHHVEAEPVTESVRPDDGSKEE